MCSQLCFSTRSLHRSCFWVLFCHLLTFYNARIAEEAALRMVELLGKDTFKVQVLSGRMIVVTEIIAGDEEHGRVLHLECGNMFDVQNIDIADIVMMETDVPVNLHQDLRQLLGRMHEGARTLSYLDLRRIWAGSPFPFKQMENNKHLSDRFPTSWSVQRGHHFYLWVKVGSNTIMHSISTRQLSDRSFHR